MGDGQNFVSICAAERSYRHDVAAAWLRPLTPSAAPAEAIQHNTGLKTGSLFTNHFDARRWSSHG